MSPVTRKLLLALRLAVGAAFAAATAAILVLAAAYLYLAPDLPSVDKLKDIQLQVPLRVYTDSGTLMAEYGEKRRTPISYADTPPQVVHAFLAAEDDRFFAHPGVDYQGLLRAAIHLVRTGDKGQGGSTITMQVARNVFLSSEKTYVRKLNEIFLALKIEQELSKEEILELYLNKIYLGNRAYGVQAAAQVYYGLPLNQLSLAQTAMIAGLPKAPSRYNPIADPTRARARRDYVLARMRGLGYINQEDFNQALAEPASARFHGQMVEVNAPHVAEMVRAAMVERYGPDAYTAGYRVFTTVDERLQHAANQALHNGLMDYDQRHGYRGPERHVELDQYPDADARDRLLEDIGSIGRLRPALVLGVEEKQATAYLGGGEEVQLDWEAMEWARPYIDENRRGPQPKQASDILAPGDLIRVVAAADDRWRLVEVPDVAGALVALDPSDGAIRALVGGFDFYQSKFNRVTQARRQPGSSFKPFVYSAALEYGFTPASLINDAPVVFEDPSLEATWRPENYSGRFYGPTRLREALVHSRNLVSIRLLRAIGIDQTIDYLGRFGFDPRQLPRNLSLALGSGEVTPLQLITGYTVLANGGYKVDPYFIVRIEDEAGNLLYEANPATVCEDCPDPSESEPAAAQSQRVDERAPQGQQLEQSIEEPKPRVAPRVVSAQNVFLMQSMMRDVIRRGTARRAMQLGRNDLAGKTGTTNDQMDAWFSGFNGELVATAWVGFDRLRPLGRRETGGHAALPVWMDFMKIALEGAPPRTMPEPSGLVTVRIDPQTGLLASGDTQDAVFETFRSDRVPNRMADAYTVPGSGGDGSETPLPEQIF